ncbi:hypothetical protein AVEN_164100-1 [Araneus ventricosus]|uniref:Uncharacterized protein n=1 Tax=Araneus ventricosus TaxID=182803 RepID=A0A4Y2VRL1_ARAVE|nr:hypothetical protein AVEN_164100-1 [Araneus ventricosus]
MSRGGFNLKGWVSNVACEFISKHSGDASVLGLLGNLDADKLRCGIDFEVLSCETVIFKRLILSLVQKIFYPLRILCAVTLPPKILLQDTWKLKVCWDIELPPDVSKKFFKWVDELYLLKEVCLPRFMPLMRVLNCTFLLMQAGLLILHVFLSELCLKQKLVSHLFVQRLE